jgi:glutamyl-tRNA(Gln) amidotransferase subunit E
MLMHDEKYYESIGFKCGLEIHQRIATKEKLFCSCNAMLPEDISVAEIERRQRAVAGELGKTDASATYETTRRRKFVYNAFRNTTCLVDMDEEPPHELNREALDIALQIAAEFNSEVPSELEPMRKEVVDGSDPSAFQRTMLVGYRSHITVNGKKINISSIFLEEESSDIEHSDSNVVIYNVDRLAVPLVEIDTDPDIKTPIEAKEVAKKIGLLLRLTGKVQRGIGSIRQDVNVSIRDGARVEVKGYQDLDSIDMIIEREVERQLKLVELKKLLTNKNAKVHAPKEVSDIFKSTAVGIIKKKIESGGIAYAARLQGFEKALGTEINPGRRLGSEVSDYAKLAGVGGIIHSDEDLVHYGFTDAELSALRKRLDVGKGDAFIIVSGEKETCEKAIELALKRAEHALHGVPNETRGVDSKLLVTIFTRPLPGGSRMYPETDVRPISVDTAKYDQMKKMATDPDEVLKWIEKETGNKQLSTQMLWSSYLPLFREILEKTKVSGSVVAPILLEKTKEIKRSGGDVDKISNSAFVHLFEVYKDGGVTKAGIGEVIKFIPADDAQVDSIIKEKKLGRITGKELEALTGKLGKKGKDEVLRELMAKYRLNIDGEELNKLLK